MKKTISLLAMLLLSILSYGQIKTNIQLGEKSKESKKAHISEIVGSDDSGIYVIKRKGKGLYSINADYFLEHYNKEMTKTNSVELELKEGKKDKNYEFIADYNNKLYLFSSFRNQKIKKKFLFVQSINKNDLSINDDIKKIAEIDFSGKSKRNSGNFNYVISRDKSKLLTYYNLPYDKNENEKFGFHVFDSSLNEIWAKQISLPYEDQLFGVEDYNIDNNGNVHLLGTVFNEKRRTKRDGKPNYRYENLSYYNNGTELKKYPIEIEGKFITDMEIAINDDQDIICAGFYSDEGAFSIKGSYFLKISKDTKEIISESYKEFGIDFITQNLTKRKEKKAKRKNAKGKNVELYKYALDDIIIKEDGGAVLIGEQYFVVVTTTTMTNANGGITTTTTYTYHYNDIIVINISPEGEIEWTEKVAKKQRTSNDRGFYSSYITTVVKDKLYFIFNDNVNNLEYKGEGKIETFKKEKNAIITIVEVNAQGKQTKQSLFTKKEAEILARPKVSQQISDNEVILIGEGKKTHRFAKVTFE